MEKINFTPEKWRLFMLTHGGKRPNAGRPKLKKSQKKESTKVVRVPLSKLSAVLKLIGKG